MKRKRILIGSELLLVVVVSMMGTLMVNQQQIQALRQAEPSIQCPVSEGPFEATRQGEQNSKTEKFSVQEQTRLHLGGQDDRQDALQSRAVDADNQHSVAVLGMDEGGYRPDVIFVVSLEWESGKTEIVSVPRDTYVLWEEDYKSLARERGFEITESKINEMLAYGGYEHIRELTLTEVERIVGRSIDHYVVITLDLFREVVDAMGGIELDVPEGIAGLESGRQRLSSEEAERMVRFRGYRNGDLGRIQAQQLFLKGVAEQVYQPENWLKIPKLVNLFFDKVDTDIRVWDLSTYYKFLKTIDKGEISFTTLPGVARYKNSKSYFFVD